MRVKEAQRKVNQLEQTMKDLEKLILHYREDVNEEYTKCVTDEADLSEEMVDVLENAYEAVAERKRELEFRIGMAEIA